MEAQTPQTESASLPSLRSGESWIVTEHMSKGLVKSCAVGLFLLKCEGNLRYHIGHFQLFKNESGVDGTHF